MKYIKLVLSGTCRDTRKLSRGISRIRHETDFRYDEFLCRIEHLLKEKKINRILIDCKSDFQPLFFASLEGIRRELLRLTGSGKELYFYAREYGGTQLYLASACTHRAINLCGSVTFLGLARTFTFYRGFLDKQGVQIQVFRRGKFKSANDAFRLKKLDPSNREQYEALHRAVYAELSEKILEGYGKEGLELSSLTNRILSARQAVEEGWVHRIATAEELAGEWKKEDWKQKSLKVHDRGYGKGSRIAVLHFEGGIMDGHSRQHPLLGQVLGADSYIPHIRELTKSKSVKGVVLRVNCPGGSATASDEVVRALDSLAAEKPLAVSFSEVAGSGGYWISTTGRRIFTEKTTITGSIGVIALMVQLTGLMKTWGISQDTIKTDPLADLGAAGRAMTPREKKIMEAHIDALYREFLGRVAKFRGRTEEEIHLIAQGRVWTGEEAVSRGLADEVGGLKEAVDFIRREIGASRVSVRFYPVVKRTFLEKQLERASSGGSGDDLRMLTGLANTSALLANTSVRFILGEYKNGSPLALMPEVLGLL